MEWYSVDARVMARRQWRPSDLSESCLPSWSSVGVDRQGAQIGSSRIRPSSEAPALDPRARQRAKLRSERGHPSVPGNSPDHQLNRCDACRRSDATEGPCRQAAACRYRAPASRRHKRGSRCAHSRRDPSLCWRPHHPAPPTLTCRTHWRYPCPSEDTWRRCSQRSAWSGVRKLATAVRRLTWFHPADPQTWPTVASQWPVRLLSQISTRGTQRPPSETASPRPPPSPSARAPASHARRRKHRRASRSTPDRLTKDESRRRYPSALCRRPWSTQRWVASNDRWPRRAARRTLGRPEIDEAAASGMRLPLVRQRTYVRVSSPRSGRNAGFRTKPRRTRRRIAAVPQRSSHSTEPQWIA